MAPLEHELSPIRAWLHVNVVLTPVLHDLRLVYVVDRDMDIVRSLRWITEEFIDLVASDRTQTLRRLS